MNSSGGRLVASQPWLSQGDVFSSVPVLDVVTANSRAVASLRPGPAMLVTHDCALDKKTGSGRSTIDRISFVRLRDVASLPAQRADLLRGRADELQPYEALYLGEIEGIGESYVLVSDPYFLPALYFATELRQFDGSLEDASPQTLLVPVANDARVGRVSDPVLGLLCNKWIAHWTRLVMEGSV